MRNGRLQPILLHMTQTVLIPVSFHSYGYEFETGWEVTVLGNTGGLVRDGYIFTGWNTDSGGNATNYDADDTFDMGTSDVILYADWVASGLPDSVGSDGR